MNTPVFSDNLLLWRKARGLTQVDLAHRARVPQPNLSAIERGARDVSLRTIRALATALGVRPGILVDGQPPPSVPTHGQPGLSREVMERIAAAVVGDPVRVRLEEQRIVNDLKQLIQDRLSALGGQRTGRRPSRRATQMIWLQLKMRYPKAVIESLVQRTSERAAARRWSHDKSTASFER